MRVATKYLLLSGCLLALGACTQTGQSVVGNLSPSTVDGTVPPLRSCLAGEIDKGPEITDEQARTILQATAGEGGGRSVLNEFLDCLVGDVDPAKQELRLLRAHILVAVLATYGAYNVSLAPFKGKQASAASLMARIETAERKLRMASAIVTGNAETARSHHPTVDSLGRVTAVFDVSLEAVRPSSKRAGGFATNLAATIAGGVALMPTLVKDALRGIRKAVTIELWGHAFRQDSSAFLARFTPRGDGAPGEAVDKKHWQMWDKDIETACAILESIAGVKQHCIPAEYQ
jgi:hypothetical protein